MLLCGGTWGKASPTVFITMKKKSNYNWLELQQQVETLSADVQMEVLDGQIEQVSNKFND